MNAGRTRQRSGSTNRLVVGVRPLEADVVAHALREEEGLLEDERHGSAHIGEPELADVVAVQRDATRVRVVEPREQAGDRALTGPCRADERDRLAGA